MKNLKSKKKEEEKRQSEEKTLSKKRLKSKKARNREYAIVSYFFVFIFLSLIGYMVYFQVVKREAVISSPYNTRQDQFEDRVVRGSILSADGQVLAYTQVNDDGSETRVYPYSNVFAHVVGYDANGKNGLESLANFQLMTSHDGYIKQFANEMRGEKNRGDDVVSTLDYSLQQAAYDALGVHNGAVVAFEPDTGAVRAMVSKPNFDPNTVAQNWDYLISDSSNSSLLNRATQGAYPPGSTFKIVTALAYLREHGSLNGYHYTCNGSVTMEDHTINCYGGTVHGEEDFTTAFAKSCNSAFAEMGVDLGARALTETAESLLFNRKLPIPIEYNVSKFDLGTNPKKPLMMQTSIGQGNTLVSPMHMAMITGTIANDGMLMKPYFMESVQNINGDQVKEYGPSAYKQLMTENEAAVLQELMGKVVEMGTGSGLSGEAYQAFGKTGSAEYDGADGSMMTHSWFTGYAKMDGRQLAIAVIAEGAGTGSQVAVPVAHQVFNEYFY